MYCEQIPTGDRTGQAEHGRIDTRTVKAAHVEGLDLPYARQAIKVTRWRQNATTKKISGDGAEPAGLKLLLTGFEQARRRTVKAFAEKEMSARRKPLVKTSFPLP